MDITINTPALLFPATSLIMLAYTNRFVALSSVARRLHDRYKEDRDHPDPNIHAQINNLRYRLRLIRQMQFFGVMSFLLTIICMYLIYINELQWANFSFALSIFLLAVSLVLSLVEIQKSTKSVELELSDIEEAERQGPVSYLKRKLGRR